MIRRVDELGGPRAHNNYPWGWTMAGNTPFKRWKREVHEGGVADPCIVSWPGRISDRGGVRHQFVHAIDILPTVLELAGIEAPATIDYVPQTPVDGISFAALLDPDGADAPPHRVTQYFEMFGSRAIYHDGWKAVTFKPIGPLYDDGLNWNAPFSEDRWELYHVAEDPTELHDLAEAEPGRLADMVERWWVEARRNQVLPLDNRILHTLVNPKPDRRTPRLRHHLLPGHLTGARDGGGQHEEPRPRHRGRGHRGPRRRRPKASCWLRARPSAASPSTCGRDGRATCTTSTARSSTRWSGTGRWSPVVTAWSSASTGRGGPGGPAELEVDGTLVAEAHLPLFTVAAFSATGAGLTCGYEFGPSVGEDYRAPFPCTATIHAVTVTLDEHAPINPIVEFERIMAEQ